jgi:hypothetical protein
VRNEIEQKSRDASQRTPFVIEMRVREESADEFVAPSDASQPPSSNHLLSALVLGVVMLIAGIYVGLRVNRSWVPADDGTLAQSALRVFDGQLPHRDFTEIYTGGLSLIHAAAFHVFGVNLLSLRICVFLFFLAWIPAVYSIAQRFVSPVAAGAISLLAVAWSFPNYSSAMPSWYNLFFATFGAAAIIRYLDVRSHRWLFIAGLCGGVSILIKVIGAYYIAGVLLFLVFLEQSETESSEPAQNTWGYRAFSVGSLLTFLSVLTYVLHARLAIGEFYHFLMPSAVVVGLIFAGEKRITASSGNRFTTFFRLLGPFGAGGLVPVVVFLTPYALSGSVGRLVSGVVFSAASRAVGLAVARPTPVQYALFALPLLGVIAAAMFWDKFQGRTVGAAIALLAAVTAFRATQSGSVLSWVWFSVVTLTPLVVALGAAAAFSLGLGTESNKLARQRLVLLVALAATCSLVQYPFPVPIYLCYALPLTLLALVATISTAKRQAGTYVLSSVLGLYLVFGVVSLIPLHLAELTHDVGHMDNLRLPRGGVQIEGAYFFEDLIHLLQQHSPNGLMYAGNDCPELYFLSGLKNVTRDDTGAPPDDVLKALQSTEVKVFVINEAPFFPLAQMNPKVRAEVMKKFPENRLVGIFRVFWRS